MLAPLQSKLSRSLVMFKKFALVCVLASIGAASALAIEFDRYEHDGAVLGCRPFSDGWQVFNLETNQALGQGYFSERGGCRQAEDASQNGFVCAAQNGGAIVADIRTGQQIGAGYYSQLSTCNDVVAHSRHGLVCGAESGGTILYSRHAGRIGAGYFS